MLIEPAPPLADVRMAWDELQTDPVATLAEARAAVGDTFAVESGGETYLFVFSPTGVRSFYDLPEERASKGLADYRMLVRKLPDELFAGRRTFPHELFRRDEVAIFHRQLQRALDHELGALGSTGEFEIFAFARRLGHRMGLASWAGEEGASGERFDRLVAAIDLLDGSEAFVHPERMAEVARSGKSVERAALTEAVEHLRRTITERDSAADGDADDLLGRIAARWSDVHEPDRSTGIALDVVLVHIASMSNLFAALGWTIVDLATRLHVAARLASADDPALGERCALESTRLGQRSIMLRYVLSPVEVDDGDMVYRVSPGAHVATLLPLLNTSSAPGLADYDPDRWRGRRLRHHDGLAAPELVTAFGHGKHTCPAQPFALAAMSRTVERLFGEFEIEPLFTAAQPLQVQIGGVARAEEPCWVRYRRRVWAAG